MTFPARLGILICPILLVLLPTIGWVPVSQQGGVVVTGRVINGTAGGDVPPALPVVLHVFSGREEVGTHNATLAADGSFRFDGLSLEEGETVVARVVYQGVAYLSDLCTVERGHPALSVPVTVYETTEEPATLLVTQVHMFLSRVGDRIQVGEYHLVSNTGDRTFVGVADPDIGRRATLSFALPDGAEGLSFDGPSPAGPGPGERFLERTGGFVDTWPVLPGTATVEVLFRYDLPYRDRFRVVRVFDVPVASVALMVPEGDVVLEGDGLAPAGVLDTEMGPARSYTAGPLAAGESLAFALVSASGSAPVAPAGVAPARNTPVETAIGLVALAAAVVAVYLLLRPPVSGPLPAQARPVVEAIAALDARFEEEKILEGAYRQERAALEAELRATLKVDQQELEGSCSVERAS